MGPAVDGGEAIAITTYNSIFNTSPKLPVPRLNLLDDAHAGEQFVGEQYGITIGRYEAEAVYLAVLDALQPFLSGLQVQRLKGQPDPGAHHQVRLVMPAVEPAALQKLDTVLSRLAKPHEFQFAMIRSGLAACCVYPSYGGIQIRPMIPPTYENPVFSEAKHRVYISATLGAAGELERAFGRAAIKRMPLPTKTPPRSGRRLFIFPNLVKGGDAIGLAKSVVGITNKALVLSQASSEKTEQTARALASEGVPILGGRPSRVDLRRSPTQRRASWDSPIAMTASTYRALPAESWCSTASQISSACRRSSSVSELRQAPRSPSVFGPESCRALVVVLAARTTTQWFWS